MLSQVEVPSGNQYVQTVPDVKILCPDFCAFMSRILCVHQTFLHSCPDFRAFTRLPFVHVQTFVRSPDFRALMSRISCVHQTSVSWADFCAFMFRIERVLQTSCLNKILSIHVQTFVRSSSDLNVIMSKF